MQSREMTKLIDIAKKCEEYVFQENPEYLKFKAKKKINSMAQSFMIWSELSHLEFHEETIYWIKRSLEEKVYTKEEAFKMHLPLIYHCGKIGEFEMALEYGKKALFWLESFKRILKFDEVSMLDNVLLAAHQMKRFDDTKFILKGCKTYLCLTEFISFDSKKLEFPCAKA